MLFLCSFLVQARRLVRCLPSDLTSASPELCVTLLPPCTSSLTLPVDSVSLGLFPRESWHSPPLPPPHTGPQPVQVEPSVTDAHPLDCPLWSVVITLLLFGASVVSSSLRPHGRPTRLLCPWNSPGKKYWSGLPFPSPGGSSWPSDWTHVSCTGRWVLYGWATHFTFNFLLTASGLHINFSTRVLFCQLPPCIFQECDWNCIKSTSVSV